VGGIVKERSLRIKEKTRLIRGETNRLKKKVSSQPTALVCIDGVKWQKREILRRPLHRGISKRKKISKFGHWTELRGGKGNFGGRKQDAPPPKRAGKRGEKRMLSRYIVSVKHGQERDSNSNTLRDQGEGSGKRFNAGWDEGTDSLPGRGYLRGGGEVHSSFLQ